MKIDEDSKLYKTIFLIISESEFFRATREIISEDYLDDFSLKPNFEHKEFEDFLLVLNRYFLEHSLEVSKELVKEKTKELTEYTLGPGVGTGPGQCPGKFSIPGAESRNSLVPGTVPKS